jgi:hypothetical protein
MDTNNDSSQGAVPGNQPAAIGRPNQYISYAPRSVQPPVVVPRPNAFTTTAAITQPSVPPIPPIVAPDQPAQPEATYTANPVPASVVPAANQETVTLLEPASPAPEATPEVNERAAVTEPQSQSEEAPINVAVAPAPVTPMADPAIQMPSAAYVPSVAVTPRPSFVQTQPVGPTIDDFRPVTQVPAVTEPSSPALPAASAAQAPAPITAQSQPAGLAINDVFTPPVRPFASPAPASHPEPEDASHIQNHLETEAQTQPKHKLHFAFWRHHTKTATAIVAAFVILGGAGGFYIMHSSASGPSATVASSWAPFVSKDDAFTARYIKAPKHAKLNSGNAYIQASNAGEYGVRALDGSTTPDTVIAADVINYGNGKVVKQSYKTVSGNDAISGTITGTYKGKPAIMSFQFLMTSKDLYELYTVGYGSNPAPNTQYFFTTFKPADTH